MTTSHLRWTISVSWVVAMVVVFFALDASSGHSWLYLAAAALIPPSVLLMLWPGREAQTIADVMRGTDVRS